MALCGDKMQLVGIAQAACYVMATQLHSDFVVSDFDCKTLTSGTRNSKIMLKPVLQSGTWML